MLYYSIEMVTFHLDWPRSLLPAKRPPPRWSGFLPRLPILKFWAWASPGICFKLRSKEFIISVVPWYPIFMTFANWRGGWPSRPIPNVVWLKEFWLGVPGLDESGGPPKKSGVSPSYTAIRKWCRSRTELFKWHAVRNGFLTRKLKLTLCRPGHIIRRKSKRKSCIQWQLRVHPFSPYSIWRC